MIVHCSSLDSRDDDGCAWRKGERKRRKWDELRLGCCKPTYVPMIAVPMFEWSNDRGWLSAEESTPCLVVSCLVFFNLTINVCLLEA